MRVSRRSWLGALAASAVVAAGCSGVSPRSGEGSALPTVDRFDVPLADGDAMPMTVWRPAGPPRGAVLFLHGLGAHPDVYRPLFERWVAAGYAVVGPQHADSEQHPRPRQFSPQQGFSQRVRETRRSVEVLEARYPGLPWIAAGHSYGSLFALGLGGGLAEVPLGSAPGLRGVVAFSSPGVLPMQQRATTHAGLRVPSLTVTGTRDVLPQFTPDWNDHLLAYQQSNSAAFALVRSDGGHKLVVEPRAVSEYAPIVIGFMDACLTGDARNWHPPHAPAPGWSLLARAAQPAAAR